MSMFPHAEQWISSALTGMLNGTVPLFATAVAAVLHRRWPPSMVAAGIAAGVFCGGVVGGAGLGGGGGRAPGHAPVGGAGISHRFAGHLPPPPPQRHRAPPRGW